MALRDALQEWMPANDWRPSADGRKFTGPNLNQGGQITIHETLLIINQLGWEAKLERADEPTSLTALVRDELEAAGKQPSKDVHKLTRQALELWHSQRRAALIAAKTAAVPA